MTPHELAEAMAEAASEDEKFVGYLRGESRARLARRASLLRAGAQAMREAMVGTVRHNEDSYVCTLPAMFDDTVMREHDFYVLTLPEAP